MARIGTIDVPSGVDRGSLEVCLLDHAGECGDDLSADAEPHGVTTGSLATALGDPDRVLRVTVRDLAGNETIVERTVGYLLDTPPPVPPAHGVPDGGTGPGADGGPGPARPGAAPDDETLAGGCGCHVPAGAPLTPGATLAGAVLVSLLLRRRPSRAHSPRRGRSAPLRS